MSGTAVFPMNMIRLCIDGDEDDLSGRAYSKLMLVPLFFSGWGEILLRMDDLFEQVGYPQAFQVRRTFYKPGKLKGTIHIPEKMMDDEEMGSQRGSCQTFDIIVQSRRQSSWQGLLMDPDRVSARKFRSEMELLYQICGDLEKTSGRKKTAESRGFYDE